MTGLRGLAVQLLSPEVVIVWIGIACPYNRAADGGDVVTVEYEGEAVACVVIRVRIGCEELHVALVS